ncbi:hypothetical protein HZH68_007736 [Vespula germanica]|uniref:Uncharacterized protein n=1 Tax=Vespula germanica TaxID=30212 RepID=A0A834K2F1_VESGE|nr:hypothetical protein HZH68_007736 [Vespula germanica]
MKIDRTCGVRGGEKEDCRIIHGIPCFRLSAGRPRHDKRGEARSVKHQHQHQHQKQQQHQHQHQPAAVVASSIRSRSIRSKSSNSSSSSRSNRSSRSSRSISSNEDYEDYEGRSREDSAVRSESVNLLYGTPYQCSRFWGTTVSLMGELW